MEVPSWNGQQHMSKGQCLNMRQELRPDLGLHYLSWRINATAVMKIFTFNSRYLELVGTIFLQVQITRSAN